MRDCGNLPPSTGKKTHPEHLRDVEEASSARAAQELPARAREQIYLQGAHVEHALPRGLAGVEQVPDAVRAANLHSTSHRIAATFVRCQRRKGEDEPAGKIPKCIILLQSTTPTYLS